MNSRKSWLVPLTGVAFVVVGIVSFVIGGEPKDAKHPAREIVNWYIDNKNQIEASAFVGIAAAVLLIFFAAHLRDVLKAGGEHGMLPLVSFIGLTLVAVGFAIDGTISIALAERADDIDPIGVQTLQALWDNDFLPIMLGVLCFLWATGIAIVRGAAFPRWLGWLMLVLGVVGLTPIGFAAAIGSALLVLTLSLLLALRARSAPAAPATAP
jgi:hypothetical protein